jgi:hypothetical protein
MSIPRVGDMLVEAGVITQLQLHEALRHQAHAGGRLGTNLVELGFIDEKTLANFLAKQLSIPSVTAAQIDRITATVLSLVPAQMAERLRAVPVREDAGRLWVAMADPTDKSGIGEIEQLAKRPVRTMVAPELLIQYALEKHYKVRRKPRVVEVRTAGSGLLQFDKGPSSSSSPSVTYAPVPQSSAPVYQPMSTLDSDALSAVTGYLDESPQVAQPPAYAGAQSRLTIKTVVDQFVAASTDEAVLDAASRFLAQDVPRVWVFLLKSSELWSFNGRGIEPSSMNGVHVPLTELPLLAQSLSTGEVLAGRLQPAALGRLAAPLGVWAETLGIIVPVRIGKHAVGVIVCIDASLDAMRRKTEIDKLAQKIDQALHINYLRRLLVQV